ncbi:hypothetical protein SH1V18_25920 [Vallitalea longa]|uniref:DUF340 domain-containing protein n=1 Tax=Vallitalea longa TaxID=2936439 RepID=A0A9W5YA27_9FIRM|nr:LysO family transporter [Vallitalea longa]GKX30112.1 hypothetical protein SH1V18_25920 [Vallitalea longa]
MIQKMLLYLFLLIAGVLIGNTKFIKDKLINKIEFMQLICLFLLLFIMGLRIGMDDYIIDSFLELGIKGIIISLVIISFSILFTFIGKCIFFSKAKYPDIRERRHSNEH